MVRSKTSILAFQAHFRKRVLFWGGNITRLHIFGAKSQLVSVTVSSVRLQILARFASQTAEKRVVPVNLWQKKSPNVEAFLVGVLGLEPRTNQL
jgi:hypothetical protein